MQTFLISGYVPIDTTHLFDELLALMGIKSEILLHAAIINLFTETPETIQMLVAACQSGEHMTLMPALHEILGCKFTALEQRIADYDEDKPDEPTS